MTVSRLERLADGSSDTSAGPDTTPSSLGHGVQVEVDFVAMSCPLFGT